MAKRNEPPKEPGTNRRIIENALQAWKKPRVDVKDPEAIKQRISEYIEYCMANDVALSSPGCASWLGINEQTLRAWYSGYRGTLEHQIIANQFYLVLQDCWAQNMTENLINPVSGIFMGKNFFGYRDTQEVTVHHEIKQEISTADLIAESKMLPGADVLALPSDADKEVTGEIKILDDPNYERSEIHNAEMAEREAERKAQVEAYAPIKKENKRKYLKEYYAENKDEYNKPRKTPEGRAHYNQYMSEYKKKRYAEKKAQKEAEREKNLAERAQKEDS